MVQPSASVVYCGYLLNSGTTYTGEYEDVKTVNDLLIARDLEIPIHVDAASGGFVAPFLTPELEWDFRLPKVGLSLTICCTSAPN